MHKFKVRSKVKISDELLKRISDSGKIKSIKVKMEATHSGFVNGIIS